MQTLVEEHAIQFAIPVQFIRFVSTNEYPSFVVKHVSVAVLAQVAH